MSSEGFICEVCHLDYSTQTQFEEHFWSMIHHKQLEIQYGTGKTHICCLCKTQSDTLSEYAKHLISKTHRDASAARKKQKQLEVASKSSNQRSNARQQTNTPNNGYPGLQNPAVQNKRPIFCIPEPGQNVHRTWARWSQPNHPINNCNVQPNILHSSAQHSAQQLNHGNGGKCSYTGNRTWTPVSGQGGPNAPTSKSVGGLKTQLASSKSAVNPSLTAKNKAQVSKANPNTGSGREPRATTASVNSKSASSSKPAQAAVKQRDNHLGASKLDSDAASRASSSKSGQALDCREVHSAAKEATPDKVATCDSTKISCAKPDQSAGTNPTAAQTLAQPDGAFSAKREWERSASCPSRTSKPGQDKMSSQDKAERSKNASAASALKKPKEACKQTHVLQRSNSVPGTPTLLKLPPEVTRLNLPRVNSVSGGKESIKNLSSIGPNTMNTVEDQPASDPIDGVDEEPSVTRVQLPPSLQRELTKLLVKSQGPRPRPNLVAARSRLHAGEHHQAQVVESPDRMVQQLLMKLLDSPKSRDRQLQQIEELQRLVQASKKGSERARFGAQQLPVVSMQVLESLLESGHLKPLLSEDNFIRDTMAQQEQSLDSAAHEQVNSQKDGRAQNLSNTATFHQELSTSLSAPDPADVDSKEAVQALIRSTLSKKGHLSTSSALGHEEENSKKALKSFTTSEAPAAPPSQSTLPRQRRQSASEMMREIVGHIVQTQDKPNGAEQPSAPVADVTIKTEPDTEVNESGDTCKWVQDFQLVDSKEAVRPLIQSTSSEHHKVDSKEPLKSLISAYANPATFHLWSTSPKQEEQVAAEVQDQTTVPDQLSTQTPDLIIKTEPDTHANDITDGAPNEENPVPTSTATWQLNASVVQPFTYDGVLSSSQISGFAMDMNNSLHGRDFAALSAPTEQENTAPGQTGTTVNMLTMPNYQVVVPYAETTPTRTAPAQRKPRAKQTRMSQKDLPSDLQEVLLELSLQEEKLHEKLSTMDRRMKTTKELIQKKQLQYKKLKDQKTKISMEVLGIRTRRLQLLQEAKPCSASAVTSSTTTTTTSQITQDPLGNFPTWLPNASVSQGNTTLSTFQGGAVPNLTFMDCNPTSLLNCPLSSELALGPLLTFPSVDSLDSSSPNMPRTQPGPGTLTEGPACQQQEVGTASKASKRSLKNATNAAVTKKAKTDKVSKTPNLTGSKSVRRKPTTQAVPDSTQATHVATGSASTSNLANSDVASMEPSMNVPKEIYSPYKNWVKEVKLHDMIDTQYRSKVTWIKVEKTPQELRDETGSESRPGYSLGSSRPSGLCKSVEGVQTQSTTEPGCYDVFEISSDSEGSASLCKSFTKTRPATASHARATPVQTPQKPDVKPCSSTQTWPPCGVFPNHDGAVLGMHLCVSGQRLYTVAADCTARVFDINDFSCKKVLSDHTKEVTCLKMWSTKYVCTGSSDRSVRVYNTETLDREISFFCESRVTCLAARVHWLYAGLANGTVDVIDMQRLRLEKNLSCKPECKINSMIPVDPVPVKGRIRKCVLVGYEDWTIGVHDTLNGKLLQSLHGHNGPILCMMIFQQLLYSGSADKTIMVHDFKTGEHLRKIGGHGSSVTGLSVFEGSLLSVSLDGKIRHIAHTGGLRRIIASFPQKIQCMTHHNQTLYIGCSDGTVQAISMQATARPGNAKKKKKKSKKVRVMCKWKGCTTKKSVHHKIYAHLWHNHVVPIAGKKCLWGKCGIMLTNFNRFQVNQHMHNHLMELYDGLQPDDAEKFKTQALLHQRKFGKKGVVNKALHQIMLAKSTAGGNKKIKAVPFS